MYLVTPAIVGMAAVIAVWAPAFPAHAQARPEGKALFEKRCGGCHALHRDKEGPRLGGVYGRTAGALDSFSYSEALEKAGVQWNEQTLDRWLADPESLVPNNDMAFRVESASERTEIIAYLKNAAR